MKKKLERAKWQWMNENKTFNKMKEKRIIQEVKLKNSTVLYIIFEK